MDISVTLILAIMFALPIVFMTMGLNFEKAKAVACLSVAAVLWFVLTLVFPVVSSLPYYFLSYVFLIPAVLCFVLALPPAVSMWRISRMEDWEKEDD